MYLLETQFERAFANIALGERERVARAAHEEVRSYLESVPQLKAFGFRTALIGSYPRHTAIWPGKDVDIFGKFGDLSVENSTPRLVYDAVLAALRARYGDRVKEQLRSIKIEFGPGLTPDMRYMTQFDVAGATLYEFSVDVVPAVHWGTRWGIPNRVPSGVQLPDGNSRLPDEDVRIETRRLWESTETRERWQETDPEALTELTATTNLKHLIGGDGAFCPTVRAIKQIRDVHVVDSKPGGLYFEMVLLEAFGEGRIDLHSWPQAMGGALESVADRLARADREPLRDPVLHQPFAPAPSVSALQSAGQVFRRLAADAAEARRAERCAAAAIWRRLFGQNGHDTDGWVFPLPDGCTEDGRDLNERPNALVGSNEARGFG